ncbi:MAG: hypothetical protein EBS27_02240 [Actinobacteria bacterium]|nr:hypothetical protein [Actinomycetota bacterium]
MAKKKLIVVWPYRFREFDWQRFELEQLSQHAEVHVHELIDALTPEFGAAYANQSERPEVKRFSSLKEWRREFKRVSNDSIIFTHVRPINFQSARICLTLRLSGNKVVGFSTGGVPNYASVSDFRELRIDKFLAMIFHFMKRNAFSFVSPDVVLVGGTEEEKRTRRDYSRRALLIFGNSSDYSQTLLIPQISIDFEYKSVFLDTGFPGFVRDELLAGDVEEILPRQWYPRVNNFFDFLDEYFGASTLIAIHPKHVGMDHSVFFGSRPVIGGKTMQLVSGSGLVIATNSTAISYSVAFEKPLILVTCDAIEKSNQRKKLEIRNCAMETGAKIFNIDRQYTAQELRDALVIDHAKRESYKRKYLTSRTDDKPNYQVLLDEVINAVD